MLSLLLAFSAEKGDKCRIPTMPKGRHMSHFPVDAAKATSVAFPTPHTGVTIWRALPQSVAPWWADRHTTIRTARTATLAIPVVAKTLYRLRGSYAATRQVLLNRVSFNGSIPLNTVFFDCG